MNLPRWATLVMLAVSTTLGASAGGPSADGALAKIEEIVCMPSLQHATDKKGLLSNRARDMERLVALADDALLVKAQCLASMGEHKKAIAAYEQVITRFPDGTALWTAPPAVFEPTGGIDPDRPPEERDAFDKYLREHPDFTVDLAMLGIAECAKHLEDGKRVEQALLAVLGGPTKTRWDKTDKPKHALFLKYLRFRPAHYAGRQLIAMYRKQKRWSNMLGLVKEHGVWCDPDELVRLKKMVAEGQPK